MKWYQSLKTHIAAALILQVALVASIAGYSYFLLDLRKHDYSILNLTGQLRVISQAINTQSQNYKNSAPGNYSSYERDLALYNKDLQEHIRSYTEIIKSFEKRQLSAELTGSNEVIYCNWDKQSISALDNAANIWREFKLGLVSSLGDNVAEPKLEAAAKYAVQNGDKLNRSTYDLASSFQKMMEIKLDNISYMNNIAVIGFVV